MPETLGQYEHGHLVYLSWHHKSELLFITSSVLQGNILKIEKQLEKRMLSELERFLSFKKRVRIHNLQKMNKGSQILPGDLLFSEKPGSKSTTERILAVVGNERKFFKSIRIWI